MNAGLVIVMNYDKEVEKHKPGLALCIKNNRNSRRGRMVINSDSMKMRFEFIDNMDKKGLKKYLAHVTDNLHRGAKYNWTPELFEPYIKGKKLAEARLKDLELIK